MGWWPPSGLPRPVGGRRVGSSGCVTVPEPRQLSEAPRQRRWLKRTLHLGGPNGQAPEDGETPTARTGGALFAQLVWAHHRWERDRDQKGDSDSVLEQRYVDTLARFEASEGRLEHVYWSRKEASAVAMTVKEGRRRFLDRLHLRERDDVIKVHRLSDWVTRDAPQVADLLQECDLLAIRVGEVLRGTSERIAMRWIVGIEAHLLGFFERTTTAEDPGAQTELAETQRKKLADIEAYYHRAASKTGRIVYVSGMLIGVCVAALPATIAAFALTEAGMADEPLKLLLLCYGAGAVGALISAMSRMGRPERGRFNIDFELGRPLMRRLGVYRPFVGAVVGVALYCLLASGILDVTVDRDQQYYYYGFAAFLSGFSERFATVVFGAAERRLGATPKEKPVRRATAGI